MYLKDKYPKTRNEFDKNLNSKVSFDELTIGSRSEVFWRCPNGKDHVWQAGPNQRTSGARLRGCPVCAGKLVVRSTSLAETYPEITQEWNLEKNGSLTPKRITSGSSKKVWWRCKNNPSHEWRSSPKHRTRQNNTCPFCDSLNVRFPQISKEWHPTKNESLTPLTISYSSHLKVWWKCPKGFDHVWQASPNLRTSMKTGCPICSGHKVVKSNSLAVAFPEIAAQWDYEKNAKLTPDSVYCKSTKKVWWKCAEGEDHEWQSIIKSRANGGGCPICSGRKIARSNSLAIKYPEIAKLWHPKMNINITPFQVTPFSGKVIWWKCSVGDLHEWQATVANVVNGSTCPVCMNRKITDENNLSILFPETVKEWDYEKNKNIDPVKVSAGSKVKVWWVCLRNLEHNWYSTIKDRAQKNSGCPFCANEINVSEHKMLGLIKDIFKGKEIKYCYRPEWLKRMEIDVYVPELKLGFEYQGIQHFRPVDFFGGEKTYIAQVQRDKLKKEICDDQNVALIYVYHDEKVSRELIEQKILNAGIDF